MSIPIAIHSGKAVHVFCARQMIPLIVSLHVPNDSFYCFIAEP